MFKMLHFNPHKRLTIEEVLNHPYLKPLRKIEEETSFNKILKTVVGDDIKLSAKQYRELIFQKHDYYLIKNHKK